MQVYEISAPDDLRDAVAAIRTLHRVPVAREYRKELLRPQQIGALVRKRPDGLECDGYGLGYRASEALRSGRQREAQKHRDREDTKNECRHAGSLPPLQQKRQPP